jgi:hypothetical protein
MVSLPAVGPDWGEAALAARFIEALQELPADDERAFGGRTGVE